MPHSEPPAGSEGAPRLDNAAIAGVFRRIAELLAIKGENTFKINAYRRAAFAIEDLGRDVADDWRAGALSAIPGIGPALEKKVDELLRTGRLEFLERLEAEIPAGVADLLRIPGVGPKTARTLWQELGVTSIEEAEQAAREGRLRALPGLGRATESKILAGIAQLRQGSSLE